MRTQKNNKIRNSNIFSTGVHLQAIEVEINGEKQWRWVAVGFEENNYLNGETIDVYDYAKSFDELFKGEKLT